MQSEDSRLGGTQDGVQKASVIHVTPVAASSPSRGKVVEGFGLPGIRVLEVLVRPDDRGFFGELYRKDWPEFFSEDIAQVNVSLSYPGIVRAWHRHTRGQVDYFSVLRGCARVCAFDAQSGDLSDVVMSEHRRVVVRIPGCYWHGTMAIGPEPALLVYLTTSIYDYANPDEDRLPWNERSIVPCRVNGCADDPRVGSVWDWLRLPHR